MINYLYVIAIVTIWLSIGITVITLCGGVWFIFKQLRRTNVLALPALRRTPSVTVVVPAHNEAKVIQTTVRAILNLNYPVEQLEVLVYADNC